MSSKNFRISKTPKAIRNNQYNKYTGTFTIPPVVLNSELNDQQNCVTYNSGKKIIKSLCYPPVVRPAKPIIFESRSSVTTSIILEPQNNGGFPILGYKVYASPISGAPLTQKPIVAQTTNSDGLIYLYLTVVISVGGSFQVSSFSEHGESPRSDLITIIGKTLTPIPGTPWSYYKDIWQ